jgi:hypothetical protein
LLDRFAYSVGCGTYAPCPKHSLTQGSSGRFGGLRSGAAKQTSSPESSRIYGTAYQGLRNCRQQCTTRRSQASLFCRNAPLLGFDLRLALDVAAGEEREL